MSDELNRLIRKVEQAAYNYADDMASEVARNNLRAYVRAIEAERDAALARVAELEAALERIENIGAEAAASEVNDMARAMFYIAHEQLKTDAQA
jgi:uncharacterized protein (UPF0335 family)